MQSSAPDSNVFVVDNPFQLLNAVEAVHALALTRNHLVIIAEPGPHHSFARLVRPEDWESVHYLSLTVDADRFHFPLLGARLASAVTQGCRRLMRLQRRRRLDRAIARFRNVRGLFLGHYWAEHKPFMRHVANTLSHAELYLVDDGTDIIDINERRKLAPPPAVADVAPSPVRGGFWRRIAAALRARYYDWNVAEAPSLTFFSAYDLQVRAGDHLIRNDYRHLRSLAAAAGPAAGVYFLGQCLAEDRYMEEAVYLEYLRQAREHLGGEEILYVPHPRQAPGLIQRIRELPGFRIVSFDVPIEFALVINGRAPRILASFFCSALESCRLVLGDGLPTVAFLISPRHLLRLQDEVAGIYQYFESKALPNFAVVRLPVAGPSAAPAHPAKPGRP
jgi:hypothetical protein